MVYFLFIVQGVAQAIRCFRRVRLLGLLPNLLDDVRLIIGKRNPEPRDDSLKLAVDSERKQHDDSGPGQH
jgi:hypothetical protein